MSSTSNLSPAACLQDFCADSLSWAHVGRWVIDHLHPEGQRCPHCGAELVDEKRLERWYQCERIECKSCSRFFTSLTGTILQRSTLDPREVYLLAVLSALQVSREQIAEILDVHKDTVRNWQQRLQVKEPASV
mgnify:CR=1 FL=1